MNEELMRLMLQMSQAKKGNRNLSGLLNNLDNPFLLGMAGVLDPISFGQMGATPGLYGQYSADPNTPDAVKAIMDYVDQGANKYQIQSQLNQLPEEVKTASGYTPEQLDAMAADMVSERSKGVGKNVFEKAGFRNPSDIYTTADVPLTNESINALIGLQEKSVPVSNRLSAEQQRGNTARVQMQNTKEPKSVAKEIERARLLTSGTAAANVRQLADWIASQGSVSEQSLKSGAERFRPKSKADAQSYDRAVQTATSRIKTKMPDFTMGDAKRRQAIQDWEESKKREAKIGAQMSNNARMQESIRQANLDRAASQGRTPFTDQLSQLLSFVSGSK